MFVHNCTFSTNGFVEYDIKIFGVLKTIFEPHTERFLDNPLEIIKMAELESHI